MKDFKFFVGAHTTALEYTAICLQKAGVPLATQPGTDVTHLLLGVPTFNPDGSLKGGGQLSELMPLFSPKVTVMGGNLQHPALEGYRTADLLADPLYLAENARITAHCAIRMAIAQLPVTLYGSHILIIGWGRIGKHLAALAKGMGAIVTIAARKPADRAMALSLGYDSIDTDSLEGSLVRYRVIFNTVPAPVLTGEALEDCAPDCLKIDLASKLGMDAPDVQWARGLPNQDAPESSGALIARTVLRLR